MVSAMAHNHGSEEAMRIAGRQGGSADDTSTPRSLRPEAQRALAEAAERRRQAEAALPAAKEVGGRDGPDPVRYGDWETGGIASDF